MSEKYQVMPPLTEQEFAALKEDIRENGVRVPVVKDAKGNTIDGHHRERAVAELRAEGHTIPDCPQEVRADLKSEQEKRDAAWSMNMQRRHLDRQQKQELIAAKLKETPNYSDRWIGEIVGVDHKTVQSQRLRLERAGEIPQLDEVVGRDGKTRVRNVRDEYVDEFEYQAQLEESKKKRRIRDILKGNTTPVDEAGGLSFYYGPKTDEAIARHMEVTPGFVAKQREELEGRGNTLGEVFGALPDTPPPLAKDARERERERRSEQIRQTKERKDEGYKHRKDHEKVLQAIEVLAHRLQLHRYSDKPKRVITPEEAVEAYTSPDIFKRSSLYYTEATSVEGVEQGHLTNERGRAFAEAFALVTGRQLPPRSDTPELTYQQRSVLDEISEILRVGDWVSRFGSLLAAKVEKDINVANRALTEKHRIAGEVEAKDREQQGSVTPLAGRHKKKSS